MDPNISDIILSAGHGGGDPGAVGQGLHESDLAIAVTNRVTQIMKDKFGFTTIQLPNETGDLQTEINQCNSYAPSLNSALAVQIHFNAGGGTGTEVWYPSYGDDNSRDQAMKMALNIAALTGLPNRGIKDASTNGWGKLGWTDDTNCYALLVECPFIDRDNITDDLLERLAMGISNGLGQIFGQNINQPIPEPPVVVAPPVEPSPTINFRVYVDGKQVGAYTQDQNAYLKYITTGRVGYINDANGWNVTAQIISKYDTPQPPVTPPVVPPVIEPPVVVPTVEPPITPTIPPIESIWQKIWAWIINFIRGIK